MSEDLTAELMTILGEDDFFALVEAHAGVRLYVPTDPARSGLPASIGEQASWRLAKAFPGGYIKVPLAREFRAVRYVGQSLTNRDIAKKLGLTESGVEKLLKRARDAQKVRRRNLEDPRQLKMF